MPVIMSTDQDWARLARAVARQRNDLRLSQRQLAERAGVSPGTIQNLEDPTRVPTKPLRTMGQIERALEWAAGSVDEVLAGGEPTLSLAPRPQTSAPGVEIPRRPMTRDLKHELRLRIITDPNLLPATKSVFIEWIDSQPTEPD